MKGFIVVTLLIVAHTSSALFHMQDLKDRAAEKIQAFEDNSAQTLHSILRKINVEKIKQWDVFRVMPIIVDKKKSIESSFAHLHLPMAIQRESERIRGLYDKLRTLTPKDLVKAFNKGMPWPFWR